MRNKTVSPILIKVLESIEEYTSANKISPTIRELGKMVGVPSTSQIRYYLGNLRHFGYIKVIPRVSRGLIITALGYEKLGNLNSVVQCPNCGYVHSTLTLKAEPKKARGKLISHSRLPV